MVSPGHTTFPMAFPMAELASMGTCMATTCNLTLVTNIITDTILITMQTMATHTSTMVLTTTDTLVQPIRLVSHPTFHLCRTLQPSTTTVTLRSDQPHTTSEHPSHSDSTNTIWDTTTDLTISTILAICTNSIYLIFVIVSQYAICLMYF